MLLESKGDNVLEGEGGKSSSSRPKLPVRPLLTDNSLSNMQHIWLQPIYPAIWLKFPIKA